LVYKGLKFVEYFYMQLKKFIPTLYFLLLCINSSAVPSLSSNPQNPKKLRILSIDGGGVRGIIPARILQAIEEETGKPIFELFDLVIGNSTGGLVALALLTPNEQGQAKYSAKDLVTFYKQQSRTIFYSSWKHKLKTGWGLWGPKYNRRMLDKALENIFCNIQLSQTLKPVLAISYSLDKILPHVWTTHKALHGIHKDYYLKDIAGATSAAPTYFAPKVLQDELGNKLHEVDGGLWANNPEFTAILGIHGMHQSVSNEEVLLVSVGTSVCRPNKKLSIQEAIRLRNAGIIGWLLKAQPNLIEMMIGADSEWSETVISILYPHNYRLQVTIPHILSNMDNTKQLHQLEKIAESYIKANSSFKAMCELLTELASESAL
jgi:patatin-like phospholipase/acyl hydrolase